MGLSNCRFTFFAVMYMADDPPVVEGVFSSPLEQDWEAEKDIQRETTS